MDYFEKRDCEPIVLLMEIHGCFGEIWHWWSYVVLPRAED